MAELTRAPTSDVSATGTWSGSAGTRYQALDDYPDTTPTDYLQHGTTAGVLLMGYAAISIPSISTAITVFVDYYDAEPSTGANAARASLVCGGTTYNAATHNPSGTTYTQRTDTWATNPRSTVAWTVDDVNGVGANALTAFGVGGSDANPAFRISCARLRVAYTADVAMASALSQGQTVAGALTVSQALAGAAVQSQVTAGDLSVAASGVELAAALSQDQAAAVALSVSQALSALAAQDQAVAAALTVAQAMASLTEQTSLAAGTLTHDYDRDLAAAIAQDQTAAGALGVAQALAAALSQDQVAAGALSVSGAELEAALTQAQLAAGALSVVAASAFAYATASVDTYCAAVASVDTYCAAVATVEEVSP